LQFRFGGQKPLKLSGFLLLKKKFLVFKANFSNFLLKYLENLKNQLTSGEKSKEIGHFWEKINFRFLF
jgi:hypothetical protein